MTTLPKVEGRERAPGLCPYTARVFEDLRLRMPWETEFLQSVLEMLRSIDRVVEGNPRYEAEGLLERLVEPERIISFRVPWTDDAGRVHVNRGHRVQFSSVLGPYKGGLRFHASVGLGSLKFLGFEQTFKNALTGLPLGGGKGGADFSVRGKSAAEVMRFCQSFMTELHRHIGPNTDVPAGDIGVGTREIGYLYGQYKRLTRRVEPVLTGKGLTWGGSRLRPEATGFGVAYFTEELLGARHESLAGKTVALSGFGQVAWGVAQKVTHLGGRVVTLSGPDGFIHDRSGLDGEKVDFMLRMRNGGPDEVRPYAEEFKVDFHEGLRPWIVPCDVAIPCAIQNELDEPDAKALVQGGCRLVVEAANMPTTASAFEVLHDAGVTIVPGKASNAGGVAVSGLEMVQNRGGESWSDERVDTALRRIMAGIHARCLESAARYGAPGDYVTGANVAGFERVAEAMIDQGVV